MIKPVYLVTSCRADWHNGREDAVKRTWGRHQFINDTPYFIVNGDAEAPFVSGNYLNLNCPDGYGATSIKQQAAYRWARKTGFTHVFQCDVDTYVIPHRLEATAWKEHEYLGRQDDPRGFCGGGAGYWLGPKAIDILCAAPSYPEYGDLWVGRHLVEKGIKGVCDKRFWVEAYEAPRFPYDTDPDCWSSGVVSVHLGRGTRNYDKQWMFDCHASYLAYAARN